jgi:electron transfer flavoprotein beta subunit
MASKQKPVDTVSLADLGLSGEDSGASQEVMGIEPVPEREAGEVIEDAGEAPAKVVEFLKKAKVI